MQPMSLRGLGFSPGEAEPKLCDPGRESGKSVIGMRGVRVRACVRVCVLCVCVSVCV